LCNLFNWQVRHDALQVADIFLDALGYGESEAPERTAGEADRPRIELEEGQLAAWAGLYFDAKRVALREFKFLDGKLKLGELSLRPLSADRFVFEESPDVQVLFKAASDQRPAQVQIISSTTAYSYRRVEPADPASVELADYEGQYHCPELNVYWNLMLDGDRLIVRRQRYQDTELTAVFADGFRDDWSPVVGHPRSYFILFDRGADGGIIGFRVSDDRMRNLRFFRQTLDR
ncbi:MAG: hypothetical protein JSW55_13335, partial [Chloroflexota bacterium]